MWRRALRGSRPTLPLRRLPLPLLSTEDRCLVRVVGVFPGGLCHSSLGSDADLRTPDGKREHMGYSALRQVRNVCLLDRLGRAMGRPSRDLGRLLRSANLLVRHRPGSICPLPSRVLHDRHARTSRHPSGLPAPKTRPPPPVRRRMTSSAHPANRSHDASGSSGKTGRER